MKLAEGLDIGPIDCIISVSGKWISDTETPRSPTMTTTKPTAKKLPNRTNIPVYECKHGIKATKPAIDGIPPDGHHCEKCIGELADDHES